MENEVIAMKVVNFQGFKTLYDSFRPTVINDEWLEDLGSYLLGRNVNLRALHISDRERQQIRQRLLREDAQRRQELEAAKQREHLEKEEEENRLLNNRLLKMVQQGRFSICGD